MHNLHSKFFGRVKIHCRRFSVQAHKNLLRNVDKTKNVVYGGDLPLSVPKKSIGCQLFEKLTQNERRNDILQICCTTKYGMTTKKFVQYAVALAERLLEEGIQKGDYVGLIGNNSLNMNVALAGIFFLGAVPFPMTHKTSIEEFKIVLSSIRPKIYACDQANLLTLKKALKAVGETDATKIFLLSHMITPNDFDVPKFSEFIKDRGKNIQSFKPAEVSNPDEELALVMKGARHETYGKVIGITHNNLNSLIARFEYENSKNDSKDVILMVQKIMWMSGLYSFLKCCYFGSKLIVMSEFDEEAFVQAIEDYKVTFSYIYSSKLWQLYKFNYEREYDLSSCKYLQAFDGALPSSLISGLKEKLGLTLKSSFGLNELTGLAFQSPEATDYKDTMVVELVPQVYGKVISDNTLHKAGPYEKGEICFKGPIVTKGYINDPKSTLKLFDKDGFLQSGLYGFYDNDGYFIIIDTIHHVITYKGQGISPKEIEGLIKSLTPVKDALVTGVKHPTDGFYPMAFVSLQKGENMAADEIISYVNGKVEDYQKLRGGVVFLPKIPRSRDTGALKRNLFKKVLSKYVISKEVSGKAEDEAKVEKADEENK